MKLLFILLLGLGFSQSIQTKQIEIYIDDISDYESFSEGGYDFAYGLDISNYIDIVGCPNSRNKQRFKVQKCNNCWCSLLIHGFFADSAK